MPSSSSSPLQATALLFDPPCTPCSCNQPPFTFSSCCHSSKHRNGSWASLVSTRAQQGFAAVQQAAGTQQPLGLQQVAPLCRLCSGASVGRHCKVTPADSPGLQGGLWWASADAQQLQKEGVLIRLLRVGALTGTLVGLQGRVLLPAFGHYLHLHYPWNYISTSTALFGAGSLLVLHFEGVCLPHAAVLHTCDSETQSLVTTVKQLEVTCSSATGNQLAGRQIPSCSARPSGSG